MELDIFDAFRAAGVPDDKARGAVDAINGLIDRKNELLRWCVGSIFSSVAMFAAITKLLAH